MSPDYPQIPDLAHEPRPVLPTRLLFGLLAFAFLGLVGGLSAVLFGGDDVASTSIETDGERTTDEASATAAQNSAFLPATPTPTPASLAGALTTSIAAGDTAPTESAFPTPLPAATALPTAIPVATATPLPTLAAARFIPQPDDAAPAPTAAPRPTEPPAAPVPTTTPIASPTPIATPTPVPYTEASVEPGTYYVLASDGLLVRDQPGGSAVTTLDPASAVVATGAAGQTVRLWVQISSPVTGWVAAEFLGTEPPAAPEASTDDDETAAGVDLAAAADAVDSDPTVAPTPEPEPTPTPDVSLSSSSGGAEGGDDATSVAGSTPGAPTAEQMAALRQCESGGNYAINTGNGYFGAYQFAQATWDAVAAQFYPDLVGVVPSDASPAEQDAMMIALHSMQGFGPWPGCRASLGLP